MYLNTYTTFPNKLDRSEKKREGQMKHATFSEYYLVPGLLDVSVFREYF